MKLLPIGVTAALILGWVGETTAQPPTYDLVAFPITPHQASIVGSANFQERSFEPTLMFEGMPASPHQISVLTPRSKEAAAANPIASSASRSARTP